MIRQVETSAQIKTEFPEDLKQLKARLEASGRYISVEHYGELELLLKWKSAAENIQNPQIQVSIMNQNGRIVKEGIIQKNGEIYFFSGRGMHIFY